MQMISGSVQSAVKLQELNTKWQQKKESGNVLSKKAFKELTPEERMRNDFQEQVAKSREASKKSDIYNKIAAGGTLSPEEEKYLQQYDPEELQKYKQTKVEKKAYEEKLKHCKTKEDVQRLKTETMGRYAATIKEVANNPYIPLSEKLKKAREILSKASNMVEAEQEFVKTTEYKKMPREADLAKQRAMEQAENNDKEQALLENASSDVDKDVKQDEVTESAITQNDNEYNMKEDINVEDILKDIEDTYERLQKNEEFDAFVENDVVHKSNKEVRHKVNISI